MRPSNWLVGGIGVSVGLVRWWWWRFSTFYNDNWMVFLFDANEWACWWWSSRMGRWKPHCWCTSSLSSIGVFHRIPWKQLLYTQLVQQQQNRSSSRFMHQQFKLFGSAVLCKNQEERVSEYCRTILMEFLCFVRYTTILWTPHLLVHPKSDHVFRIHKPSGTDVPLTPLSLHSTTTVFVYKTLYVQFK